MWKSGAGRCNHLVPYLQMSGSYLNKMGRFRNSSRSHNYQGTCFLFKLAYLQKANPAKPIVHKNPWAPKGNLCNDMSWSRETAIRIEFMSGEMAPEYRAPVDEKYK